MASCCRAYDAVFDERQARKDARRYRRRGLGRAARRLVECARARGLEDATVLEVGGGVGAIQIELLEAGAARTTNVELSSGYEDEAASLLRERGLEGRVERRVADFTAGADSVPAADVVVMHRVVCCYPDPGRLVGAAAAHASRLLVFSFPRDNVLSRAFIGSFNLWCSLRGVDFRAYVHPIPAILAAARDQGLELAVEGRSGFWLYVAFVRGS